MTFSATIDLLDFLAGQDGYLTIAEIARATGYSRPSVRAVLQPLETAGKVDVERPWPFGYRLTSEMAQARRAGEPLAVEQLTPRVRQAVHALLETLTDGGPVTAAQVMIYDESALTVQGTAAALTAALRLRLADRAGPGLWTATRQAWEMRRALEGRVTS